MATGSTIVGTSGDDKITGTTGDDTISGGAGNDLIDGGYGFDNMDGGDGIDIVTYAFFSDSTGTTIDLSKNVVTFASQWSSGGQVDKIYNFENVIGGGGSDNIIGNANNNSLSGGDGNDTISGGSGNDLIDGGYGFDSLDGGEGIDTVTYAFFTDSTGTTIDLSKNVVTFASQWSSGGQVDKIYNFENVIGGGGSDNIIGNANNNSLSGGDGNDTISGGAGNDLIDGGYGFDSLDGGDGVDTVTYAFFTDSTGTTIDLSKDVVTFTSQWSSGGQVDKIYNFENVIGGGGNDTIIGNSGSNVITGGAGNDSIDGGSGVDTAMYAKLSNNYTISKTSTGYTVKDNSNAEGTDVLISIERLQFSDKTVALDINNNAGQAYRLYQAAFARTPDNDGLKYWINKVDAGVDLKTIAAAFQASAEFQGKYGANPTADQLITAMYANVLKRAPDQAGNDYWKAQLNSGAVTKDSLLVNFSESNENQVNVIGVIQNGIDLT